MGGARREFPSTLWSEVLEAGDPKSPRRRERLDALVRAYWKPVYAYVRASWGKTVDDAKDLTQAFFAQLLSKDSMSRVRPERGSFRGYLKTALKHFLVDAERAQASRRPERPVFGIEAASVEPAPGETPERAYDREWTRCLFEAAVGDLRGRLAEEGKRAYFECFRLYCLEPRGSARPSSFVRGVSAPGPTYADVARALKLKESDVRNYLSTCRVALREILRARIRETVVDDGDVDAELEAVLRG